MAIVASTFGAMALGLTFALMLIAANGALVDRVGLPDLWLDWGPLVLVCVGSVLGESTMWRWNRFEGLAGSLLGLLSTVVVLMLVVQLGPDGWHWPYSRPQRSTPTGIG